MSSIRMNYACISLHFRMLQSIMNCRRVIAMASQFLLSADRNAAGPFDPNAIAFDFVSLAFLILSLSNI